MLISVLVSAQDTEESVAQAIKLFDSGRYRDAELIFKNALNDNPESAIINYYYGASRTENNNFTNSDLESLIVANQDESPIKINYYFGIQYHARSNWERALKFYNKYNSVPHLSEEEKQDLLEKIQQCYDKKNPFEEYVLQQNSEEIIPGGVVATVSESSLLDESELASEEQIPVNETIPVSENENETIKFQVNNEISYLNLSHFRTEEGKSLFKQGNAMQKELGLALIKTEKLREKYNFTKNREEKKLLGQDILTLENKTYTLKREATQLLIQAKNLEYEYWQNASSSEIDAFAEELDQIKKAQETSHTEEKDSLVDSTTYINPDILLGEAQFITPVEEQKESDLIYKIQIGAYSRGLPAYIKRLYDKLSLIRKIENYTDENGIVVYTTGNLTNLEDAIKMQNQVRQEGVEDAFVVPYFNGKRISLKEAKELEGKQ